MSAPTTFPTLAHALAALDAFPLAGALEISPENPGVDFDALDRARTVLSQAWRDDLPPANIAVTQQGGITITWGRAGWTLELTVDPFALNAFRLDSPSKMAEWMRAAIDATVSDTKAALAAMTGGGSGVAAGTAGAPRTGQGAVRARGAPREREHRMNA
jgi:hypothetical protein